MTKRTKNVVRCVFEQIFDEGKARHTTMARLTLLRPPPTTMSDCVVTKARAISSPRVIGVSF